MVNPNFLSLGLFGPLAFPKALLAINKTLQADQILYFCNILWCLWKARNEEMFAGKKSTAHMVLIQAKRLEIEASVAPQTMGVQGVEPVQLRQGGRVILVDGSWDVQGKARVGMAIYNRRGDLVFMLFQQVQALDPLHAEAQAVLAAIRYVTDAGNQGEFTICSDNKNLVKAINDGDIADLASWKAAETVMSAINIFKEVNQRIDLKYITWRALQTPHNLANWARKSRSGNGTPIQCLVSHLEIEHKLKMEFFRRIEQLGMAANLVPDGF